MSQVTSKDGTKIAFDKQGEGPPVILVGGAFQYRAFDQRTQELAALLAPRLTVYNYDRRGRGESGESGPWAVEREVEDLAALLAETGPAAAYGMSSGAALIIEAVAAGLPVTKAAFYEAPYIVDDSRPGVPEGFAGELSELVAAGKPGDAVERFMTTVVMAPPEMVQGMRSMPPVWGGFEAVAHTLPYDQTLMGTHGVPAKAADVTVPTLVIDGGASDQWVHSAAEALTKAIPNAERKTLEGQSHDVAPDVLAPVLIDFYTG
jgi:pimeloyl-ACP methyl ester carboxylesterase